jgi:acyl-coenzyme A thioesterase PaaI-like protein
MISWHKVLTDSRSLRLGMNLWPPFIGAGIYVDAISPDFRQIKVSLNDRLYNRNYVGTHFGGSLFAMTDPFYMLMLMRNLGSRYYVWDLSAGIEFLKPATGRVKVDMNLSEDDLQRIRSKTADGSRHETTFALSLFDEKGELVAKVSKAVYVRLKAPYRPGGTA